MKNIEVSKIIDPIPASDGAGVKLLILFQLLTVLELN